MSIIMRRPYIIFICYHFVNLIKFYHVSGLSSLNLRIMNTSSSYQYQQSVQPAFQFQQHFNDVTQATTLTSSSSSRTQSTKSSTVYSWMFIDQVLSNADSKLFNSNSNSYLLSFRLTVLNCLSDPSVSLDDIVLMSIVPYPLSVNLRFDGYNHQQIRRSKLFLLSTSHTNSSISYKVLLANASKSAIILQNQLTNSIINGKFTDTLRQNNNLYNATGMDSVLASNVPTFYNTTQVPTMYPSPSSVTQSVDQSVMSAAVASAVIGLLIALAGVILWYCLCLVKSDSDLLSSPEVSRRLQEQLDDADAAIYDDQLVPYELDSLPKLSYYGDRSSSSNTLSRTLSEQKNAHVTIAAAGNYHQDSVYGQSSVGRSVRFVGKSVESDDWGAVSGGVRSSGSDSFDEHSLHTAFTASELITEASASHSEIRLEDGTMLLVPNVLHSSSSRVRFGGSGGRDMSHSPSAVRSSSSGNSSPVKNNFSGSSLSTLSVTGIAAVAAVGNRAASTGAVGGTVSTRTTGSSGGVFRLPSTIYESVSEDVDTDLTITRFPLKQPSVLSSGGSSSSSGNSSGSRRISWGMPTLRSPSTSLRSLQCAQCAPSAPSKQSEPNVSVQEGPPFISFQTAQAAEEAAAVAAADDGDDASHSSGIVRSAALAALDKLAHTHTHTQTSSTVVSGGEAQPPKPPPYTAEQLQIIAKRKHQSLPQSQSQSESRFSESEALSTAAALQKSPRDIASSVERIPVAAGHKTPTRDNTDCKQQQQQVMSEHNNFPSPTTKQSPAPTKTHTNRSPSLSLIRGEAELQLQEQPQSPATSAASASAGAASSKISFGGSLLAMGRTISSKALQSVTATSSTISSSAQSAAQKMPSLVLGIRKSNSISRSNSNDESTTKPTTSREFKFLSPRTAALLSPRRQQLQQQQQQQQLNTPRQASLRMRVIDIDVGTVNEISEPPPEHSPYALNLPLSLSPQSDDDLDALHTRSAKALQSYDMLNNSARSLHSSSAASSSAATARSMKSFITSSSPRVLNSAMSSPRFIHTTHTPPSQQQQQPQQTSLTPTYMHISPRKWSPMRSPRDDSSLPN